MTTSCLRDLISWFILRGPGRRTFVENLREPPQRDGSGPKRRAFGVNGPVLLCRRTQSVGHEPLRRQGSSTTCRPPQPLSAQAIKHIWVRTALFEKVLDQIVQYIVDNSR